VASLEERVVGALRRWADRARQRLEQVMSRPPFRRPLDRVRELGQAVDETVERLHAAARRTPERKLATLATLAGRLEALSPLKTLARGYALATRAGEMVPVRDASTLRRGDQIDVRFSRGSATCKVEKVFPDAPPGAQRRLPFDKS
jgi:exodeoxyribonuclease VII large subunit